MFLQAAVDGAVRCIHHTGTKNATNQREMYYSTAGGLVGQVCHLVDIHVIFTIAREIPWAFLPPAELFSLQDAFTHHPSLPSELTLCMENSIFPGSLCQLWGFVRKSRLLLRTADL